MVSRRSKDLHTLGTRLVRIEGKVDKHDRSISLPGRSDSNNSLGVLERGSVGTEHLGLIERISSSDILYLDAPGGVEISNPIVNPAEFYVEDSGILVTPGGLQAMNTSIRFPSWQLGFDEGSTAERPTYMKSFYSVFIRGHFRRDNGTRTGVMFTLPAGFRPTNTEYGTATAGGQPVGEIKVFANGQVTFVTSVSTALTFVLSMNFYAPEAPSV